MGRPTAADRTGCPWSDLPPQQRDFLHLLHAAGEATAKELSPSRSVYQSWDALLKTKHIERVGFRICAVTGRKAQTFTVAIGPEGDFEIVVKGKLDDRETSP